VAPRPQCVLDRAFSRVTSTSSSIELFADRRHPLLDFSLRAVGPGSRCSRYAADLKGEALCQRPWWPQRDRPLVANSPLRWRPGSHWPPSPTRLPARRGAPPPRALSGGPRGPVAPDGYPLYPTCRVQVRGVADAEPLATRKVVLVAASRCDPTEKRHHRPVPDRRLASPARRVRIPTTPTRRPREGRGRAGQSIRLGPTPHSRATTYVAASGRSPAAPERGERSHAG
jgi:hypothetical protein